MRNGRRIFLTALPGLVLMLQAMLVVGAVSVAALTILGFLWIAYSFLDVYVLSPP